LHDCRGEALENRDRDLPVDTAVGNALAVFERLPGNEVLAPADEFMLLTETSCGRIFSVVAMFRQPNIAGLFRRTT